MQQITDRLSTIGASWAPGQTFQIDAGLINKFTVFARHMERFRDLYAAAIQVYLAGVLVINILFFPVREHFWAMHCTYRAIVDCSGVYWYASPAA